MTWNTTNLVFCQLWLLYHFYTILNSHLFIWRQMWFYVLTIAVKCYFEMQIKLWLRDFHENGVVYKVAVWKQVQRETFCGPIWGFVTKRLVRGRCRTRSWGPSVMKDLANGLRLVFSLQITPPVKVKFQFKTPNSFPATLKMMRPACWKWDFLSI